ncbi:PASTA domain-containing protein [Stratiformator vulcanicus]|uniref:PASTA domain-containing protein n=1 Tax=Stratiformator vulcanicus TaxID=2527980 RepID=A0A517QZH1_9PLAN|nr:PASTA domain-containing protein [Stratiformator vulcanicus]QDT37045.1 hypothetical protein Pan189_14110 [Stratiformator vulcanicus]
MRGSTTLSTGLFSILIVALFGATASAQQAPAQPAKPDPALDKLLQEWHLETKKIEKLNGTHRRWVYDFTFGIEKRAKGKFYFEAPDRGRMDIEGLSDAELAKYPPATNKKVGKPFELRSDANERWICDGARVVEINDKVEEYKLHTIPEQSRGQNIMDGPLPFLFGMPPDKAKQRYKIHIAGRVGKRVKLFILPNWKQDASNWRWAEVILDTTNYLPEAVKLLDPGGAKETTYRFDNMVINRSSLLQWLGGGDPFRPNLRGYKKVQTEQTAAAPPAAPLRKQESKATVPSVVGLHFSKAKEVLQAKGYSPQFHAGGAATAKQQIHHVARQIPEPGSEHKAGEVVHLQYWVDPSEAK